LYSLGILNCAYTCKCLCVIDVLSCDDYLEDERENYQNCSVLLCTAVVHNNTHSHEHFLQLTVDLHLGLFLVHLFRFSILYFSVLA